MDPVWLLVAVSGFVVTSVISQNEDPTAFAAPPPLPATGTFLLVSMSNLTK